MAHYGTLRNFRFTDESEDIRGANIYGVNDEKLGKIDDVILDHTSGTVRYAVVDTGGWLSSRKFLVPANRIEPYHRDKNDFYVGLDKSRIEQFPPYDEKSLASEKDWGEYETRYQKAWTEAPVQHREGSERNITPTSQELPPPRGRDEIRVTAPDPTRRISPGGLMTGVGTGGVGIDRGATDISEERLKETGREAKELGPRWARFESRVRHERERIVRDCPDCPPRKQREVA